MPQDQDPKKPKRHAKVYRKAGRLVTDTDRQDRAGRVPTHFVQWGHGKNPGETWEEYEERVLAKTEFSPDTAVVRDIEGLEPDVRLSVERLMVAAQDAGHHIRIAETRRTQERQEMLFQQGRREGDTRSPITWTLTSEHTPGRAADFIINNDHSGSDHGYQWLQANAPKFGFNVLGRDDPGHVSLPARGTIADVDRSVEPLIRMERPTSVRDALSFAREPELRRSTPTPVVPPNSPPPVRRATVQAPNDDPFAKYERPASASAGQDDPFTRYDDPFSKYEEPSPLRQASERLGLPGIVRFGKGMLEFFKEAGVTALEGYKTIPSLLTGDVVQLQEAEERATNLAKGLITFPYHAVKHTREVTQRALGGDESVTPSDISEAWAGGAMGVSVPVSMARGGVRGARAWENRYNVRGALEQASRDLGAEFGEAPMSVAPSRAAHGVLPRQTGVPVREAPPVPPRPTFEEIEPRPVDVEAAPALEPHPTLTPLSGMARPGEATVLRGPAEGVASAAEVARAQPPILDPFTKYETPEVGRGVAPSVVESPLKRIDRLSREGAFEHGAGTPAPLKAAQNNVEYLYRQAEAAQWEPAALERLSRALDQLEAARSAPAPTPPPTSTPLGRRPTRTEFETGAGSTALVPDAADALLGRRPTPVEPPPSMAGTFARPQLPSSIRELQTEIHEISNRATRTPEDAARLRDLDREYARVVREQAAARPAPPAPETAARPDALRHLPDEELEAMAQRELGVAERAAEMLPEERGRVERPAREMTEEEYRAAMSEPFELPPDVSPKEALYPVETVAREVRPLPPAPLELRTRHGGPEGITSDIIEAGETKGWVEIDPATGKWYGFLENATPEAIARVQRALEAEGIKASDMLDPIPEGTGALFGTVGSKLQKVWIQRNAPRRTPEQLERARQARQAENEFLRREQKELAAEGVLHEDAAGMALLARELPKAPRAPRTKTTLAVTNVRVPEATRQQARVVQSRTRYHVVDESGKLAGKAFREKAKATAEALRTTEHIYDALEDRVYRVLRERPGERGAISFGPIGRPAPTPVPAYVDEVLTSVSVGGRVPLSKPAPFVPSVSRYLNTALQKVVETTRFSKLVTRALAKAGVQLDPIQNPWLLAKAALDSPKRIEGFLFGRGPGRWNADGNWELTGTPSLSDALKPLEADAGKLKWLRAYLDAAHALELEARGEIHGFNVPAARKVVASVPPEIRAVAGDVRQIIDDALQYAVDAGGVSPELAKFLRERDPAYVPFYRAFEEGPVGRGAGRPDHPRQPIDFFEGSERPVTDPIENTVEYVSRMVRYADIVRAGKAVIDVAEAHPNVLGELATRVGVISPAGGPAINALGAALSKRGLELVGDRIHVFRNGQLEVWRVDPLVADGLRGLGHIEHGLLSSFFGVFASGLRTGVTANPAFGASNWFADNFVRALQSDVTKLPFEGALRGLGHAGALSPEFTQYRGMGGGMGMIETAPRGSISQFKRAIGGEVGRKAEQQARNARVEQATGQYRSFQHPIEALRAISQPFEEASRFAEFSTLKRAGRSDLEAYVRSQEHLGNFAEHGSSLTIRGLTHATAFMNPALQAMRAMGESVRSHPGKWLASGFIGISLPTLYFWLASESDPEVRSLQLSDGGLGYWFFRDPFGSQEIIRVRKPFLYGQLFGTTLEQALNSSDPHALERLRSGITSQLAMNFIPTLGYVGGALYAERDPFFDTRMIPMGQEGLEPGYEETAFTTELAKRIGKAVGVPPPKLEFVIRNLGGTLGQDFLRLADNFVSSGAPKPSKTLADLPQLGRFFGRYPSTGVPQIRDLLTDARVPLERLRTYDFLLRENRVEEAGAYLKRHENEIAVAPFYQTAIEVMSIMRHQIKLVETAPNMTPDEKRSTIDRIMREMIQMGDQFHQGIHAAPLPKSR